MNVKNPKNNSFQTKNVAIRMINKVEGKAWAAAGSADWQSNNWQDTAQAQLLPYLVPLISELLKEQFTWHLDKAKFLINLFFTW